MKKLMIGLLAAGITLGAGTALAAEDGKIEVPGVGTFSFEQMLPFMKQMHPNISDQQLKDMFNACHGNGNGPGSNQMMPQGTMMRF